MQNHSKMGSIAPYTLVYMRFLAQVVETKLLLFMSIYYLLFKSIFRSLSSSSVNFSRTVKLLSLNFQAQDVRIRTCHPLRLAE